MEDAFWEASEGVSGKVDVLDSAQIPELLGEIVQLQFVEH